MIGDHSETWAGQTRLAKAALHSHKAGMARLTGMQVSAKNQPGCWELCFDGF